MKSWFSPIVGTRLSDLFRLERTGPARLEAHSAAGSMRQRRHFLLFFPLAIAAVLSFYSLGAKNLWLDEAISVQFARHTLTEMWHLMMAGDPNMGLYLAMLHFWLRLGTGEFMVRLLSAIMAIAAVVPVYAIGNRLFGARTGIIASLLLAANPFFVRYAQEARSYSLFLLLATTASYFFLKALDKPSVRSWLLYSVVGALSIYAHFFGVWVIAVHFVSAMTFGARRALLMRVMGSQALIVLLTSPLIFPLVTVPDIHHLRLGWVARPSLDDLGNFFVDLTGGGRVLAAIYGAASAWGVFSAWTRQPRDRFENWSYGFLLTWLFLPVIASFLFSILIKPIFVPRYLIASLPPLVLIAGAGLRSLRLVWFKLATLLLLLAFSSRGLTNWYTEAGRYKRENWRAATQYVLANSKASDGVIFEQGFTRIPFEYYLHELRPQAMVANPVWPSAPWGALDTIAPWPSINRREYPRLWRILLYEPPTTEPRWLPRNSSGEYCLMQRQSSPYLQIMLYQTCP